MYWFFAIKSKELHSRAEGAEGLQSPAGIQDAKSCSLLLRNLKCCLSLEYNWEQSLAYIAHLASQKESWRESCHNHIYKVDEKKNSPYSMK